MSPTPVQVRVRDSEQSGEASLQGHPAKTPIISAIVSSSAVITIWALVFLGWLWKQYKKRVRAKRRAARGLPPKVKKPKKPLPVFILPPDPAVITGQREPGERAIPRKHGASSDKDKGKDNNVVSNSNSIELNERERNRPVSTECQIHDERIARQVFSKKHSTLDPPKHDKRSSLPPKSPAKSTHESS